MAKVDLRNIVRNYGVQEEEASRFDRDRPALNNINLTIEDGEILSVVGPSGCGKSTLLKVVAGLEFPDQGQVLYNGYDVSQVEPQKRGIGMVFQDYALYPTMKGKGNLHYYFEVHQRTEEEMEERVHEIARIMGVGFDLLMGQKTDTLSGGEQQRVAIGRCIVRDPLVFLMDEPISNLDAKLRESTRMEIKKMLRKFKVTTLYVTHDQQEAIFMGDRIVVMRQGNLEQVGSYDDLYYTPSNLFVATFIGAPPMAILPVSHEGGTLTLADGQTLVLPDYIAGELPTGAMRMGVRPEGWMLGEGLTLPVRHIERIPTEQAAFIHGSIAEKNIAAVAPLDYPQADQVQMMPNWDQIYFFSAEDETPLYTPGVPELF
ncbi:MAG: ABC transporter ATP-binding protein [Anaerolineae bacterium]|nr:ABC transporter ATP-binding protein [Anaerolineae bacterium]